MGVVMGTKEASEKWGTFPVSHIKIVSAWQNPRCSRCRTGQERQSVENTSGYEKS